MLTPHTRGGTLARALATGLLISAGAPALQAQESTVPSSQPLWEASVFAGTFATPAYLGARSRVTTPLVLPYLTYRGETLGLDRKGGKVKAVRRGDFSLDLDAGLNFGSEAKDVPEREGMPDLGTTMEIGPSAKWVLGESLGGRLGLAIAVRGSFDLNDRLAFAGMSLLPELSFERSSPDGWQLDASVGPVWGDRKYLANFYEVAPQYATLNRPAYEAQSGLLSWRGDLALSKQVGPRLKLLSAVRIESARGAANTRSPLLQRNSGVSAFAGLTYSFWQSEARASF